jgi:hypothetical protein
MEVQQLLLEVACGVGMVWFVCARVVGATCPPFQPPVSASSWPCAAQVVAGIPTWWGACPWGHRQQGWQQQDACSGGIQVGLCVFFVDGREDRVVGVLPLPSAMRAGALVGFGSRSSGWCGGLCGSQSLL